MATFLFDEIIFGPVKSRRLGVSLGINLLPLNEKVCNFDCIYCECGWTPAKNKEKMPELPKFSELLEAKLTDMTLKNEQLDMITFAGNGEPTLHKDFSTIVDITIETRNKYYPNAKIAVLSNASTLNRKDVTNALKKIDVNIQKIDSAFSDTIALINRPVKKIDPKTTALQLKVFDGNVSVQTMFVRGKHQGAMFDNTTEKEIAGLIDLYKIISPKEIMIYCISRDTPSKNIEKIPKEELDAIADKIKAEGFIVHVSY